MDYILLDSYIYVSLTARPTHSTMQFREKTLFFENRALLILRIKHGPPIKIVFCIGKEN